MGADCFSASSTERVGRYSPHRTMYKYPGVLIACGVTQAAPGYGHAGHYHQQSQCTTEYDIKLDTACQTYYDQACHEEYDVVVDTTYVEECQDIVTQHCQETSQQVHHSSAVVGHDSQVVSHGHVGYHKREAEADAEPGYGHNNLQCFSKPHKQCHQKPVQTERKVPRPVCKTIVDTTYIEECQETFTTECTETHQQVHHSSAVVGHDSQVVSTGIVGGYHKRSAEPSADAGYGYGPQCQQHVERQCHKVPQQHERKVPRPVCHKVPRQQCHPTAHKVARKVCEVYGHGHGHGGHGHGHGHGHH